MRVPFPLFYLLFLSSLLPRWYEHALSEELAEKEAMAGVAGDTVAIADLGLRQWSRYLVGRSNDHGSLGRAGATGLSQLAKPGALSSHRCPSPEPATPSTVLVTSLAGGDCPFL